MLAVTKSSKMAELRNCSLADELNSAAGGTGLAFIVMAEVFVQVIWLKVSFTVHCN